MVRNPYVLSHQMYMTSFTFSPFLCGGQVKIKPDFVSKLSTLYSKLEPVHFKQIVSFDEGTF